MHSSLRVVALGAFTIALTGIAAAQSTPGPPDWQDGPKSVYAALPTATANTDSSSTTAEQTIVSAKKADTNVVPSAHGQPAPAAEPSGRRLAPPSARLANERNSTQQNRTNAGSRRIVDFGLPTESMYTVATALAIVVGAFLIFAWVLRRGGRVRAGGGLLPADAVSVLGCVRLTGRQMAELLRVGNKLVLVAVTPSGAETLTEVTDPAEVDRLTGLCQQHDRHSTSKAFEQVIQQLSREPMADSLFGTDPLPTSISPAASAYRSQRGDRARV